MSPFRSFKKKLMDAMDCPCSALTVNCCQFGCFISDVPLVEYSFDNATWMTNLVEVQPDIKLKDLCIPGTHDSATCTIDKTKLFSGAGRCQNCSVLDQLQRGCRYLDIRIAGKGSGDNSVAIYHGFLEGADFKTVLDQVAQFLQNHPGEFVFVEVVHEYGRDFTPAQKKHALDLVQSTFGEMVYTEDNRGKLLNGMTLKELIADKKQVCVLVHNRIYGDFELDGTNYDETFIRDNYGFFNSGRWMRSRWHNTRDVGQLLEWNLDEVKKYGPDQNLILTNQFVLTPGVGGANDVVKLLVGQNSLRPVSLATSLYQKDVLDDFLREHAEEAWNIIMLDYVDLAPALVSFLIGLNFPDNLEILAAAASPGGSSKGTDVTSKMKSFVKRNKVLFLTDVSKDLGLDFQEGKLTIAYRLGGGKHQVLDLDFDPSSEILVGQYSHNEGTFVHVDPESFPSEGVFHQGKIVPKEAFSGGNPGTALQYRKLAGGGMEFSVFELQESGPVTE